MKDPEIMMKKQFKEDDRSLEELKKDLEAMKKEKKHAELKHEARQELFDKIQDGLKQAKKSSAAPSKISEEITSQVLHWFNYQFIMRLHPEREDRYLSRMDKKIRELQHKIKGGELLNEKPERER